ncbi:Glycogen synthase [compost metagenome]|uniref:glycosyltransferase family 4 protein n=1 Tax=Pseudomonas putida TaxID=303 RepID=UPI000F973DD9|nr:glycosyltransferase family 4 protein [Pseudomonas putida]MDD2046476.1 glycosyltransferase family 4 protein [Pseudomonas putida]
MRILHFFKTALPDTMGGIEQVIHQISRGAPRLGVTCEVLSLSTAPTPATITMEGYNVHRVKQDFNIASTGFSLQAISKFRELAKNADIINYHFPWPFMDLVHFLTRPGKPSVLSYHSDIVNQKNLLKLYSPIQNRFLKAVDRIIVSSPNYLDSSPVLREFKQKAEIIPIGLDKQSYPSTSPELLAKWKAVTGPKFFLFIGVLRYYKGLHILLEALQNNDFPVVIIGNGPKEQELKAQAIKLGLKNVLFLGRLPDEDKAALLTLCYSVVFPSHLRSEAFGITLLEGAMYGKPMISCEIGTGTTFININNETGIAVPPANAQALSTAMRTLWNNPETAASMGKRAEQRYWQYFTADKMVRSYVDVYKDILK